MSKSTGKCLSRRKLIGSGIAAGAGIALGLPSIFPAAQEQSPAAAEELVLVNGRIHTMDRNNSIVSGNGWFLREENQLGSIEPGKLADLAVLSDDYFTVPDESLKKIRSIMTVVNGSIAHNANIL